MMKVRISLLPALAVCALVTAQAQVAPAPQASINRLTLQQAEQLALKNNPRVSVAKLLALAEGQVTRQARGAELPNAVANLTAVEAHPGSRIAAGGLNNPIIFERAAAGVTLAQVITDFGRSGNLLAGARLRERAQQDDAQATAAEVVLATDQTFYRALAAQALLRVAEQTVAARQTTADQVQALANAKLKSDLDLSFANVNLAQAKLLLLDARNSRDEAFATLNTVLGFEKQQSYLLIDETAELTPSLPGQSLSDLVSLAFQSRPDLKALDEQWRAAERFRRAEHDLSRPTLSALAAVGDTPVRADQLSPWFGAVGVNLSIPVFNGFIFSARAHEAEYRTLALGEQVRDLRNRIARDVQVTYLQARSAFERIGVTAQLQQQANLALELAQTRYRLGLGSIVELSQAQLQQTEAAIGNTNARYDYETVLASLRYQTGQ